MPQHTESEQSSVFNFTKATIEKLPFAEPGKRVSYRDASTAGLELRVSATSKVFYLYKWFGASRQPTRVRLGDFPTLTLKKVRKAARDKASELENGINLNAQKKAIREEMTLGELFESCMKTDFRPHLKPNTLKEYQGHYDRHLANWANKPLSQITNQQIRVLHNRVGEEIGPYAANRLFALISCLFNKAINKGFNKPNPARGIKKFREKSRERFLEADELPRFFAAVAKETNETVRDYVLISLLTGARKQNVLSMRWADVYLERAIWEIPETKNGTSQRVALTPEAVKILEARKKSTSEWVFPSESSTGHLCDPKKGWQRILKAADISNLHIHDLRRSLGSWQAATGASLSVIGKTLNHKNVSTTAIYARLNLDPVRDSLQRATNAMLAAGRKDKEGEVIELNKVSA